MRETDLEIEQSLVESSKNLVDGNSNPRPIEILRREFGPVQRAFVVYWIPEQGEDIYTVVLPPGTVAIVEIPRDERAPEVPSVETVPFKQYLHDSRRAGKEMKRKLAIVQKLL